MPSSSNFAAPSRSSRASTGMRTLFTSSFESGRDSVNSDCPKCFTASRNAFASGLSSSATASTATSATASRSAGRS